jgi:hypothetical protein
MHVYEIRPRDDKRGVDLISDALPFGRLWYGTTTNPTTQRNINTIRMSAPRTNTVPSIWNGSPPRPTIRVLSDLFLSSALG